MSSESFCAFCGRPAGSGHEPRCYDVSLAESFKGRTDIKHPPLCKICNKPEGLGHEEECFGDSAPIALCPVCKKEYSITPFHDYFKGQIPVRICSAECEESYDPDIHSWARENKVSPLVFSAAKDLHKVASSRNMVIQAERDVADKRLIEDLIVRWVKDVEESNSDMAKQGYYCANAELWVGRDWENESTMQRCVRKACKQIVYALKEARMYRVDVDFRFNEERVYIKSSWNPRDAEDEED